jgi:hypothetical protein
MKLIQLFGVILSLISTPAWAQESDDFDWKIAPYLWTVGVSGDITIGEINQDIDVSFSDILSDFELGGAVYAEAGKGNHAFHIDYTYIRTRTDPAPLPTPPFPEGAEQTSKMTINIFEAAYNYRWNGADGPALVLGARLLDIKIRMNLGDLPALSAGPDWWDYFVGVKTHNSISTNWDFDFYGTVGTGGSDLPWTVQGMFGRRFSNGNRLGLGVRVWGIDYAEGNGLMGQYTALDATFYGLMIGYEFN